MSTQTRLALIEAVLVLSLASFLYMTTASPKPDVGSTALCETVNRFPEPEQDAWDFWMGPYSYFPCKQLPLEANV